LNLSTSGTGATRSFDGTFTGSGSLTKSGTGVVTMAGSNTYTGGTTVNAGTLKAGSTTAFGSTAGTMTVNGGTLDLGSYSQTLGAVSIGNSGGSITGTTGVLTGSGYTFNNTVGNAATVSAILGGTGNLSQTGSGTTTLSGANTYSGDTLVGVGTLRLTSTSALPSGTDITIKSGGTLDAAWSTSGSALIGNVSLGATGATGGTLAGSGAALGDRGHFKLSGNLTVQGTSTSIISADLRIGDNLTKTFTIADTGDASGNDLLISGKLGHYNGNTWGYMTKAGAGTLRITGTLELGGITVNTGKLALNNASGVGMLGWIGGPVALTNNAEVELNITGANTATLDYGIAGTGSLTKVGTGTAVLNASSTYSGATTVSAGTLALTKDTALGTSAGGVTVDSGATLDLRGVVVGTEAVALNGGTLATSTGTSSLAGTVTLGGASTVAVSGTQLTLSGVVSGTGFGLTKTGSGTAVFSGTNTYSGGTSITAGALQIGAAGTSGSITGAVTNSGKR
jgi:autotransporter-associated beta strand protein